MSKNVANLSKLSKGQVANIQGKDHATYDGVLDLAHREGLVSLTCKLIQAPGPDNNNTAICEACAIFEVDGKVTTFSDIGDADARNTNSKIALHIIRMASTRAKGRTLRDGLNIKGCTAEELEDYAPNWNEEGGQKAPAPRQAPREFPQEEVGAGHPWKPTEKQSARLMAISKNAGLSRDQLRDLMAANGIGIGADGQPHIADINSKAAYDSLCDNLIPAAADAA